MSASCLLLLYCVILLNCTFILSNFLYYQLCLEVAVMANIEHMKTIKKTSVVLILNLSQRQSAVLRPLEPRNLFGPRNKVSSNEKLMLRSGVCFVFLFVLRDAILLNLDLQKRPNFKKNIFGLGTIHKSS